MSLSSLSLVHHAPTLRAAVRLPRRSPALRSARGAARCCTTGDVVPGSRPPADTVYPEGFTPNSKWPTGVPPDMGGHKRPDGLFTPPSQSTSSFVGNVPHEFQYYEDGYDFTVLIHEDGKTAEGLVAQIAEASKKAIAEHGSFAIALSGGSLLDLMTALPTADIDFTKWCVFFVDERCVPLTDDQSNYKGAQDAFLSKCAVPASQIFTIDKESDPLAAAKSYEAKLTACPGLPKEGSMPVFDMILLGIGPDGHVASLFPNKKECRETESLVLPVFDSPKPPSARITFTFPLIRASKQVMVVATGSGKAEVIQRAIELQTLPGALPAQLVRASEKFTWMLDSSSAANLNVAGWEDWKLWMRSNVPQPPKEKKPTKAAAK